MRIIFTESAVAEIRRILDRQAGGRLKLVYDAEGCGCAVSGVPTLWITDEPDRNDFIVAGDPFEVLMDRKHEVFFEENMTVDYQASGYCFILKSSGQIYNANMRLIDKRNAVANR
ncbi:hypothetical protein QJ48_08770 [Paenibacillus sp. A3]|uniref:iron-sulfur cluster biosynthesis family protein n=1 Tax=Paenibacillus sp. A3 TaxID=1337054 RepID=UPI0006D578D2|nr:iron-sulfur cluster biosynthesis family protein [Paenibacillus sp. A3]KPV59854.1 hypothetical protein QJ48_08770 [Paenibacillus sp. A3]